MIQKTFEIVFHNVFIHMYVHLHASDFIYNVIDQIG